jgi:hypothetical protein
MRGFRFLDDLGVHRQDVAALINTAQIMWAEGPYDERAAGL